MAEPEYVQLAYAAWDRGCHCLNEHCAHVLALAEQFSTVAREARQRAAALEEALRQMREAGGRLRARLKGRGHSRSCHIYPAGGKCSCYYDSDCLAWDRAAALAQKDEPQE